MKRGTLFVVSGPSGAGKSTLTKDIVNRIESLYLSVSATTRKPREGEVDGKDYHFISIDEFKKDIDDGGFLEYAEVHGNFYGTLKREVENKLDEGKDIILEIDVQGGEQIKKRYSDAVMVFVTTPSAEELERRLRGRATDSEEVIKRRLINSLRELEYKDKYEYIIVNDKYEETLEKFEKLVREVKL